MSDKYPTDTDRRRFVTGVIGGGTLAGVSAGALAAIETSTPPKSGSGGRVGYYGVENVAGPAHRALPQVPVTVEDGEVHGIWPTEDGDPESAEDPDRDGGEGDKGIPEMELGGVTYTPRWYQYCGVEAAEGLQPDAERDTVLRHQANTPYEWQRNRAAGTPLTVEDFADYREYDAVGDAGLGKPAMATWRARDDDQLTLGVGVVRSPRVEQLAEDSEWLAASTDQGFLAFLAKCTHFCCVPGFKRQITARTDAADLIYCPCHQSQFDPFSIVRDVGNARPRPP